MYLCTMILGLRTLPLAVSLRISVRLSICTVVLWAVCYDSIAAASIDSAKYAYEISAGEFVAPQFSLAFDTIDYEPDLTHKFVGASYNIISDSTKRLYPFFEKLLKLRRYRGEADASEQTVSIVHIGDSHVQADFKPGTVRKLMQLYFGNAGRGLIAPLKIAKTNGAGNYKISSDSKWDVVRLVKPGEIPIGLTGLGLRVNDTMARLNVSTIDESFHGEWAFNKITSIYDLAKSSAFVSDSLLVSRDTLGSYGESFLLRYPVSR